MTKAAWMRFAPQATMYEMSNARNPASRSMTRSSRVADRQRARCMPSWGRTAPASRRCPMSSPGREGYEVTGGTATLRRRGPAGDGAGGARRRGRVPGVPVSGRNSRRRQRELPAHRAERAAQARAARRNSMPCSSSSSRAPRLKRLAMSDDMLKRAVNVGFSGGEKKRNEILQMALLQPKLAILDETDSGLDIDALRIVADGVNALRGAGLRCAGHHALPAAARLHRARPRACAGRAAASCAAAGRSWRMSSRRAAMPASSANRRRPHEWQRPRFARRLAHQTPLWRLPHAVSTVCANACPDHTSRATPRPRCYREHRAGRPPQRGAWKYTNLRPAEAQVFHEAVAETGDGATTARASARDRRAPAWSSWMGAFAAISPHCRPMLTTSTFAERGASSGFDLLARPKRDRLVALNTMLAEDGAIIDVAEGIDGGFAAARPAHDAVSIAG